MQKNLPIGIQSFEKIRQDGYLYIDKTKYVWDLVEGGTQYFLSRPRRFGKSLFISTLKAYFEGKKDLFRGLAIEQLENRRQSPWVSYPVILFSFSGGEYGRPEGLSDSLGSVMMRCMKTYSIDPGGIYGETLSVRFVNLISALREKTGHKVVVLVDEYDKPLLETMLDNQEMEEANRKLFKAFFSMLKDADENLKFVFITGVTKFNKVSIFSDLNQLKDISLLPKYSTICGITDDELKDSFSERISVLAANENLSEAEAFLRLNRMYDGYHFSKGREGVYNPFSLFNALDDGEMNRYWFESGTPTFLYRKLEESRWLVQEFSDGVTATESRMSDYRADSDDLIPLYYQSGYLTIKGYDRTFNTYTLAFPNEEVKYGFLENLIPMAKPDCDVPNVNFSPESMLKYLNVAAVDSLMKNLQALLAGIPYYEGKAPENEQQWRNIVYAVFTVLGQYVRAEVHSAKGRSDCVVENDRYIYIFEFKQDRTADEALRQIDDMGYALPYEASRKKIVKVGANFSTERKTLDAWIIA